MHVKQVTFSSKPSHRDSIPGTKNSENQYHLPYKELGAESGGSILVYSLLFLSVDIVRHKANNINWQENIVHGTIN